MPDKFQVIEPSIEVFFHLPEGHDRPETFLEEAGRTCYKSEDRINPDSADRFIGMLNKRGHHAMLEHAVASARIVCDRGVTHELVRHRLASYAQESTRYCDYSKDKFGGGIHVIEPMGLVGEDGMTKFVKVARFGQEEDFLPVRRRELTAVIAALENADTQEGIDKLYKMLEIDMTEKQLWTQAMCWADQSYRMMRQIDSPPQRARHVLPIGVKTEIVITANLREWMHIFRMRCAPAAHPHIRELFLRALQVFAERVPAMFKRLHLEMTGKLQKAE
jgi:thymidylate synthase (FAD)